MFQAFQGRADPVAVFVDGDNLSHRHAEEILATAETLGPVTLRRVYGNMTQRKEWAGDLRFSAYHSASDTGKNSADIRLVIDALEHSAAGRARSFVIASNDSDFGPLALRLRELGHAVVGVGQEGSARAFRSACSQFVRLETEALAGPEIAALAEPRDEPATSPKLDALDHLMRIVALAHGEDGAIPLALLGSKMGAMLKPNAYGAATWRGVLAKRQDRYVLEGAPAETRVTFIPNLPVRR